MTERNHAAIWIDHLQARIFYIGLSGVDSVIVHSHLSTQHLHHKADVIGSGHVGEDKVFHENIEKAIEKSEDILILGPSTEKAALKHYLDGRGFSAAHAVTVQPAEQMTDHEIIALAKQHFHFSPTRFTS